MVCCSLGGPAWTQLVAFPVGVLEWDLVWFLEALCDWGAPDWIHLLVLDLAQVPWSAALMQELVLGLEQAFPLAQAPPENECNSAYDAHCLPIHSSSILWENKTHKAQFRLDIPHFRKKPKNHSHRLHTCH